MRPGPASKIPYPSPKYLPKWNKCDPEVFSSKISQLLPDSLLDIATTWELDAAVATLSEIILQAAAETIPTRKVGGGKKRKDISPAEVALRKEGRQIHGDWIADGKPTDGPLVEAEKINKKKVRAQRRRDAATVRQNLYNDILGSANSPAIFKILRRTMSAHSMQQPLLIDGKLVEDPVAQLDAWCSYYQQLYTPDSEDFDAEYLTRAEDLSAKLPVLLESARQHNPITEKEVYTAIQSLNRRKCPDEEGMVSEHLLNSVDVVTPVITSLLENARILMHVPDSFKTGIVTNVPKKGKPLTHLANHRGITVTTILGKVLEAVIEARKKKKQRAEQHDMQFGFSDGLSPVMASLLLRECITDARERDKKIYITTLDARKAFDVVSHPILHNSLYFEGCDPETALIIREWYSGLSSKIVWRNLKSEAIPVKQGIRQGGLLSTGLYKSYINPLLSILNATGEGYQLGSCSVASPTVADDVLLIAEGKLEMQHLINISHEFSKQRQYLLHPEKSEIICIPPPPIPEKFHMGDIHCSLSLFIVRPGS